MDKEALAAKECVGAGPRGEASPAVVGLVGSAVEEVEATIFLGKDWGQTCGGVVLRLRGYGSIFQSRKRFE